VGRLFWKFFLFIWLAQLAGIFATGAIFWFERQQWAAQSLEQSLAQSGEPRWAAHPPPGEPMGPPPHLHGERGDHPHPPGPRPPQLPWLHILAALLASLGCAAGLAWYIAKPIRQLRSAFDAAAHGQLDVKVGDGMGGRRDELADLGQDFDHMMNRLRALMEGQQRLLHDVSHELRSPLARLHAAIDLARQQPQRQADSMRRIEREGERMNKLVGELLTLSRIEAGVSGGLETVDLGELLSGLVDDARFEAATRRVTVDYQETPDLQVLANPEMLHRAIENVLRNALRFSPEGATVRLESSRLADGRCSIGVLDQGPGVAAEVLEEIFKPFFRSESAADGRGDGKNEGYGLGLAIARRVLAAVDGEIRAENRPEGGLRVTMVLPLVA
jgi:signal transduction histidine kinase